MTMQKKLLSGLFWVLLANLLVKPFWILGVEVGVQNAVGNEMYGFYFSIFNLSYILNILLDLGITNFNTRNIAQHPQLITKHLSGILGIKVCLLGLYLVATFTVGALMGYGSEEFYLLAWLSLCQFLNSLILYLRSNFEGLLLFKWDSLFSVLDRVLMILICGCLLWSPLREGFNIYWFVYAQAIAYGLTALLAFAVIAHKARLSPLAPQGRRLQFTFHLSPSFFLVILKKSAPFALLVLLMASYNRIDPILLRKLASNADAGIYAGAFRLLDALTMVAYLVSVPLLPIFSRLCKEMKPAPFHLSPFTSHLSDILRLVFWPMMLFAVGVSVACAVWAEPIMQLLYHNNFTPYVPVFRVVIFGIIPINITYIFGTLLTAGGYLRQLNIFAASTLLLNIVVNLLLIPYFGATGSAWASLTAQSFMAITQFLLAIRLFRLPLKAFLPPSPHNIYKNLSLLLKHQTKE